MIHPDELPPRSLLNHPDQVKKVNPSDAELECSLLREGGPISYQPRPSRSSSPNPPSPHHPNLFPSCRFVGGDQGREVGEGPANCADLVCSDDRCLADACCRHSPLSRALYLSLSLSCTLCFSFSPSPSVSLFYTFFLSSSLPLYLSLLSFLSLALSPTLSLSSSIRARPFGVFWLSSSPKLTGVCPRMSTYE